MNRWPSLTVYERLTSPTRPLLGSAQQDDFSWVPPPERGRVSDGFPVKQFIRNVRASKTIADERAVVQKESAAIRASFREESGDSNVRSVHRNHLNGPLLIHEQEE